MARLAANLHVLTEIVAVRGRVDDPCVDTCDEVIETLVGYAGPLVDPLVGIDLKNVQASLLKSTFVPLKLLFKSKANKIFVLGTKSTSCDSALLLLTFMTIESYCHTYPSKFQAHDSRYGRGSCTWRTGWGRRSR